MRAVALKMKRKFSRPQMKEYRILSFEEDRVLVEFPGLTGSTQQDLEVITQDLLKTMTVQRVSAAYIDGVHLDLFGIEAASEARDRAKQRNRETNKELGIVEKGPVPKTVEDLRKDLEGQ